MLLAGNRFALVRGAEPEGFAEQFREIFIRGGRL
jgi:hypothetical protein